MINMKMSKEEAKEYTAVPDPGNAPEYPYGLRLSLDDDALEKLGITELPKVGTVMVLQARVEVCGTSAYSTQDKESEASVSLQITDMELGTGSPTVDASRVFNNSSMNP